MLKAQGGREGVEPTPGTRVLSERLQQRAQKGSPVGARTQACLPGSGSSCGRAALEPPALCARLPEAGRVESTGCSCLTPGLEPHGDSSTPVSQGASNLDLGTGLPSGGGNPHICGGGWSWWLRTRRP